MRSSVCDTRMATTHLGRRHAAAQGQDGRAPAVGLLRAGRRQPVVDITAEEVPILDGSAASFVFLLQSAGHRPAGCAEALPARAARGRGARRRGRRPEVGAAGAVRRLQARLRDRVRPPRRESTGQRFVFDMGSGRYKRDIARARTFGFTKDVEMMRARGLALGGSLDNAVVVDELQRPQQRRPALRRRVRQAQDPRRDRRPVARRPAAPGRLQRVQVGPCAEQQARPRALERPLGLGDRHLRRRDDRTCGPGGASSRVVSRSIAARAPARVAADVRTPSCS